MWYYVIICKDCGLHIIKYHKVYKVRRLYFILVEIKKIMVKSVGGNNHKKISLEVFPLRTLQWTLYQSATFLHAPALCLPVSRAEFDSQPHIRALMEQESREGSVGSLLFHPEMIFSWAWSLRPCPRCAMDLLMLLVSDSLGEFLSEVIVQCWVLLIRTDIFLFGLIEKRSDIALRCAFHCQVPKSITQGHVLAKEALSYPGIMKENTRHLPQIQTKPLCDD